jgi:hypothetical protein
MYISLDNYDITNILDWIGDDLSDMTNSERRTYEKLLQIQGLQKARLAADRTRPRRERTEKRIHDKV